MAWKRMSWTTKPDRALVCETLEQTEQLARALLGPERSVAAHYQWSNRQGGYVIYNEAGTKMIVDAARIPHKWDTTP